MALVYDRKKEFPIDPRLNPLRFKRKRPVGRPKKLGLALTREQPLMPGGLEVPGGPQGRVAQVAGEGSGDAHTGGAQRTGGAVWSSWRKILGIAGDIGNLQGVGEDRNQNEGEDTEGGGQEESDGAISQEVEEEEARELDMDID